MNPIVLELTNGVQNVNDVLPVLGVKEVLHEPNVVLGGLERGEFE